jgi:predicted kinase
MLSGFPGSGKTTFTKTITNPKYILIDRDVIKDHNKMFNAMKTAIHDGLSVVLDATFTTKVSRKPFINFANKQTRCIIFDTPIFESYVRNKRRALDVRNTRTRIPLRVYKDFYKKYEEPATDEGFLEIKKFV